MGTWTVLAPSAWMAGQTLSICEGQALELLTWAPRIRNGAPSTIRAWRPSFSTSFGASAAWATPPTRAMAISAARADLKEINPVIVSSLLR
jgi:hypothetical protein